MREFWTRNNSFCSIMYGIDAFCNQINGHEIDCINSILIRIIIIIILIRPICQHPNPTTEAEFAFSIYDADGSQKIDAFDLGDVLRALNCNPTLALIEKVGQTKKRNEKLLTLEEFLPIYGQVKAQKEQGCYEDFIECLKLYDKNEDGTMLSGDLSNALLSLGETLTQEQVDEVFKDCLGEENDEGEIKYARKWLLRPVTSGGGEHFRSQCM